MHLIHERFSFLQEVKKYLFKVKDKLLVYVKFIFLTYKPTLVLQLKMI